MHSQFCLLKIWPTTALFWPGLEQVSDHFFLFFSFVIRLLASFDLCQACRGFVCFRWWNQSRSPPPSSSSEKFVRKTFRCSRSPPILLFRFWLFLCRLSSLERSTGELMSLIKSLLKNDEVNMCEISAECGLLPLTIIYFLGHARHVYHSKTKATGQAAADWLAHGLWTAVGKISQTGVRCKPWIVLSSEENSKRARSCENEPWQLQKPPDAVCFLRWRFWTPFVCIDVSTEWMFTWRWERLLWEQGHLRFLFLLLPSIDGFAMTSLMLRSRLAYSEWTWHRASSKPRLCSSLLALVQPPWPSKCKCIR